VAGDWAREDPALDGDALFIGDQGGLLATNTNGKLTGPGARLIAVNIHTGNPLWVTRVATFPGAMITSSPVIYKGIVYIGVTSGFEEDYADNDPNYACCVFRGNVAALNESTGQILWKTYTMPSTPSNPGGYAGGGILGSTPVVDPARGSLYVGTGNNYAVPPEVEECIRLARAMGEPDSVCNSVDNYGQDYFDSMIALDLNTGHVKWAHRFSDYDTWNSACELMLATCPSPKGLDTDFSAGPNLFQAVINGTTVDVLGEGGKSGVYSAVNPSNGTLLWSTSVGGNGGIQWGTASDGQRVYVPFGNEQHKRYTLPSSGVTTTGGVWNALDPTTGNILWQTAAPGKCRGPNNTTVGCSAFGAATVANGLVYVGSIDNTSTDPTMFALNAATGQTIWSFASGMIVHSGPAIVGDTVYWGSGYVRTRAGTMYAFTLPTPVISLVQQTTRHPSSVSEVVFRPITVGQGHLLVAHATVTGNGVVVSSVSDSNANPWTRIAVPCIKGTVDNEFWYTANAAGGSTLVTLNLSGTAYAIAMNLSEWSGTLPNWSHDTDSPCSSDSSSTPTTSLLSTTGSNDLILAACSQALSPAISSGPANGFAPLTSAGTGPLELHSYTLANGSNGPFQTGWTTSLSSNNACSVTSFIND
jgi:polyvinyl alcohol dehydrogenase (cytochrome)